MQSSCPYCGSDLDHAEAQPGSVPGTVLCPTCGQEQDMPGPRLDLPLPPPAPARPDNVPPWEGERGFLSRLFRTTGQVLGKPGKFFSAPSLPGYAWALSYALIVGTFGIALETFWGHYWASQHVPLGRALWGLVLSPLLVLLAVFFTTWVLHFFLWVVGGAKNGVRATFRVVAYSQATNVFLLLPVAGHFVSFVWWIVTATAGLAAAHGIGKGRAFFALVLPAMVLIALMVGLMLTMLLMGLGAEIENYTRHIPGI